MSIPVSSVEYSLHDEDLLPPEEPENHAWREYCRVASTVDRQHVLECVLSDLDMEESPLYEFIDDALDNPHEPGRAKANITDLARLGQALLNMIAKTADEQVGLKMALG